MSFPRGASILLFLLVAQGAAANSLIDELATGDPLDGELRRQIVEETGVAISKAGLRHYYSNVIPNSNLTVEIKTDAQKDLKWEIWFNSEKSQKPVGYASFSFQKKSDGSLDMHVEQIVLQDKLLRGGGLAARFIRKGVALLQALSRHPKTVLSLEAWTGRASFSGHKFGGYIWAPYGFDYSHDEVRNGILYAPKRSEYETKYGPNWARDIQQRCETKNFWSGSKRPINPRSHQLNYKV